MSEANGDLIARAHTARVERYYDFIYHWTQLTNRFRAFKEPAAYAIHRGLVDPANGEFSTSTVHRLIAAQCPSRPGLRALDAGCGYAGSMIEMHKLIGGVWDGITISRRQVRIAQQSIDRLGLGASVRVRLASFDQPLGTSRYDLIVAIESLIHSAAPATTIRCLSDALADDGLLVIVDDMPVDAVPERLRADLESFKRHWHCPVMPRLADWCDHIRAAGLDVREVEDLTSLMRPRSADETHAALDEVARKRSWRDTLGLKLVSDAQEGGLRLEHLTREGAVAYQMIVARKPRREQR